MAKRARPTSKKKPSTAAAIFRSLRVHQWIKNGLVFVPLVLGGLIGEYDAWSYASLGFLALSLAASASYILNDIRDIESDRRHWSKRDRPFASGALSIRTGYALAALLLIAAFGVAALIGPEEMVMLAIYVIAALSYTLYWKRIPVFDIFVLASLFTFRIALGILILDVRISPWLMIFSMFVFLSLSAAKRHTELLRNGIEEKQYLPGRGYLAGDAPLLLGLGLAAMLGAVLINIVYLLEDAFPRAVYGNPVWLWSVPPVIFLFLGRIWLLSQRGLLLDDPVAFALKDRVSLSLALVGALGFAAALIGLPTPS
ncbi:MAG: UbiA family prenyltransferase [Xanthobacteraceae bacterium]|nr:UbiA family prenyltransferase [Xanthobacteraceae bacterium]